MVQFLYENQLGKRFSSYFLSLCYFSTIVGIRTTWPRSLLDFQANIAKLCITTRTFHMFTAFIMIYNFVTFRIWTSSKMWKIKCLSFPIFFKLKWFCPLALLKYRVNVLAIRITTTIKTIFLPFHRTIITIVSIVTLRANNTI